MNLFKLTASALVLLTGVLILDVATPVHAAEPEKPIHVGVLDTMFRDMDESSLPKMTEPLTKMLQAQTGQKGDSKIVKGALELGRQMEEGKYQLGVFGGVEFGWAKQKYPDLTPLVIAVNKHRYPKASILVNKDSKYASLADLKGKKMGVPFFTRDHSYVFLDRTTLKEGSKPDAFYELTRPKNPEAAMDEVARGKLDAAVVDSAALEWYKDQKPGLSTWLKVLKESEAFPPVVVAYIPSKFDKTAAKKTRDSLLNTTTKTAQGRDLLGSLRVTGFEAAPKDYDEVLDKAMRLYPAAEGK
ncbi:MAG: phosphate/phosphite/phosphonate ABC transporter substrate-binding protein [Gemmataceae bacterium]|nr:phosphate/phosphite/phosphonate ABC transporter substrate-binding protein [Gemmataceae bacterium]